MCSILKATSLEGNIKMWQNYPTFHLITPFNICFIEHLINNKTMGVKKISKMLIFATLELMEDPVTFKKLQFEGITVTRDTELYGHRRKQ